MKKHGLLLERHTGRRRLREHDGQVATIRSNVRWCSDGLEFTCWNGEVVRVAFALDCHDRNSLKKTVPRGPAVEARQPWHGEPAPPQALAGALRNVTLPRPLLRPRPPGWSAAPIFRENQTHV